MSFGLLISVSTVTREALEAEMAEMFAVARDCYLYRYVVQRLYIVVDAYVETAAVDLDYDVRHDVVVGLDNGLPAAALLDDEMYGTRGLDP